MLARLRLGVRHVATAPLSGARALEQTVPIVCQWDLRGYGMFAVVPRECDDPIGLAGPWQPRGWAEPELGFLFLDTPDTDSLGPEALRCARRFAEKGVGWVDIVSHIVPDDRRAAMLLRAAGAIADPFVDPFVLGTSESLSFRHPVRRTRTQSRRIA